MTRPVMLGCASGRQVSEYSALARMSRAWGSERGERQMGAGRFLGRVGGIAEARALDESLREIGVRVI